MIDLPITLEGTTYPTEAVVADIGTAGIVGINFLREHQISANFGTGELGVRGTRLFLQRKASVRSFQLRVARATVVPPFSETIVDARPRRARTTLDGRACIVQPVSTFARDTGLALGGTLVKSSQSGIPLLVVNPTETPVVLPRGMVAATVCAAAGV